jgi:hypothetical protein
MMPLHTTTNILKKRARIRNSCHQENWHLPNPHTNQADYAVRQLESMESNRGNSGNRTRWKRGNYNDAGARRRIQHGNDGTGGKTTKHLANFRSVVGVIGIIGGIFAAPVAIPVAFALAAVLSAVFTIVALLIAGLVTAIVLIYSVLWL